MFKFLAKIFGKKLETLEVVSNVDNCTGCNCDCEVCCPGEVKEEVKEETDVRYYTLSEVCKVLGKSDRTVRKMLREGEISGEKVDGKWRIVL